MECKPLEAGQDLRSDPVLVLADTQDLGLAVDRACQSVTFILIQVFMKVAHMRGLTNIYGNQYV